MPSFVLVRQDRIRFRYRLEGLGITTYNSRR